jgi:thioredoxin-like negative regulator of GroEL
MDIPVMYGIYSYPEVVMFYEGQPISQFKGKRNVNFMMFWIRKSLPYITFDVKKGVNENTIENIKEVSNNDEDEENKGSEEIELTKEEVDTINSQLKSLEKNIFEKEVILEELLLEKREYSYLILYIVLFIIILLSFFILLYIIIKGLRKKEKSI